MSKGKNKLRAVAEKNDTIYTHNLGRKKLNKKKERHNSKLKTIAYTAAHSVVSKASTIAVEDLTFVYKSKKKIGKNQTRRLSYLS